MKDMQTEIASEKSTLRANTLFKTREQDLFRHTDRMFAGLMIFQWLGSIGAAFWISPRTWTGPYSQIHLHIYAALFLGGAITLYPVLLTLTRPGRASTRHTVAVGQTLMSALLIHLTGGRIETHFHVFGSLAFLAFYRDWRVLVTASAVVALDHFLRGVYWPQSVFGVLTADSWRWLEHAGWVIFEDVFLAIAIFQSRKEMMNIAGQQSALETVNEHIEGAVQERTSELKASQERFRSLSSAAPIGIFQTDAEVQCTYTNEHWQEMAGLTFEESLGDGWVKAIHPEDRDAVFKGWSRSVQESRAFSMEFRFLMPQGEVRWVHARSKAVFSDSGRLIGHVGTHEDITENKRAEEALRDSNRRLEEAMGELRTTQHQVIQQERLRALGQMASGIAHDFNNALSPISGFSELLLSMPEQLKDTEKVKGYLEIIHTAAQDSAGIVRRLRDFYRHREKGEFFLPVHLNQVVEQVVSLTQPKWKDQALAGGVTLDIRTDLQRIPVIAGNDAELREVLTNLIFNAVDAMSHDGTITLRTRQEGEYVLLEVKDTGTGMTEEVRERCLEPFFSTKGEQGTGLGLAMVFGILQRHEGTIDIQSKPGEGTTFSIRLPVLKEQMEPASPQETATPFARLRILLVDDDPRVRETVRAFLVSDEHEVAVAFNGREGLEKFHAGNYDLVMTDRAMPEMSGDHLAAPIKKLAPHKPVIMLTGFGDMMEAADEHPGGVDIILSKPVKLAQLREALVNARRHSHAHSTGDIPHTPFSSTTGHATAPRPTPASV